MCKLTSLNSGKNDICKMVVQPDTVYIVQYIIANSAQCGKKIIINVLRVNKNIFVKKLVYLDAY